MSVMETAKSTARRAWYFKDRVLFRRYARRSDLPVILCYSMGKVGSTSILRALKATKFADGVQHMHFLNSDNLPKVHEVHKESGFKTPPEHLKATDSFKGIWPELDSSRLIVVMAVRDPVAFAISDFFQNPYFFPDFDLPLTEDNVEEISRYLVNSVLVPNSRSFAYWNNWLASEMEDVFDFKFSDYPFDRDRGWSLIQTNKAKIACIQLENLRSEFPVLTSSLLGEKVSVADRIANNRSSIQSFYGDLVNRIAIPKEALDQIYSSPFVRYFYSADQIEEFSNKWGVSGYA